MGGVEPPTKTDISAVLCFAIKLHTQISILEVFEQIVQLLFCFFGIRLGLLVLLLVLLDYFLSVSLGVVIGLFFGLVDRLLLLFARHDCDPNANDNWNQDDEDKLEDKRDGSAREDARNLLDYLTHSILSS